MTRNPAYLQYQARRGARYVAIPLAAWFVFACVYSIAYSVAYSPQLGNGERASERYLESVRQRDDAAAQAQHQTTTEGIRASEFWVGLIGQHGAIRTFARSRSQITKAPLIRTQQRCVYDITFADRKRVSVEMTLAPRRFGSTEWAITTVTARTIDPRSRIQDIMF